MNAEADVGLEKRKGGMTVKIPKLMIFMIYLLIKSQEAKRGHQCPPLGSTIGMDVLSFSSTQFKKCLRSDKFKILQYRNITLET